MAFNPGQFVETLRLFIEQNSKDIFAFVENNRRPMELGSENQLFGRLMRELVSRFPHCHCENGPIAGHAEPDKTHYELAIAILIDLTQAFSMGDSTFLVIWITKISLKGSTLKLKDIAY
jgi:hypothetical protein